MSRTETATFLRTIDLTIGYHTPLIAGIDLSLSQGETVAIIGPNGSGKSTFLSTLGGLIRPLRGRIEVVGRDVTDWAAGRRASQAGMAFVRQETRTFRNLTVAENLHLALWHDHLNWAERRQQIDTMLAQEPFGLLADVLARPAGQLSGGEDLLLALAGCLLRRSSLILLDEPSGGLDTRTKELFLPPLLKTLSRSAGVVLVEQNIRLALAVSSQAYLVAHTARGVARLDRLSDETRRAALEEKADLLAILGQGKAGRGNEPGE